MLHLKYKLLLCESKIKLQNLPGGKALAIDSNASLVCFTQNTPYIIVLTTETNILEHDDSFQSLLFSVDQFHYLNVARVGSSTVYGEFDCTFKCLRNRYCLSVNLASYKDANGKLWCELLSSNSHGNSPDYRENKTSHHLFLLVGSVLFTVCLNFDKSILLDYISKIILHITPVQNSSCCTAEPPNNNRTMRELSDRIDGLK